MGEERKSTNSLIDGFHIKYEKEKLWERTSWLGIPTWKLPFDLWIIQELIFKIRPDYIIETGTSYGGSALFYASIMSIVGHGQVITVDKEKRTCESNIIAESIKCGLVKEITGDSVDSKVFAEIENIVRHKKNMVFLDSWHTKEHVLKELNMYSALVPVDSYIVAEDTHVSGHPVPWQWGEGPMEAVEAFLRFNPNFESDKECEKLIFTFNPCGYLKRIF